MAEDTNVSAQNRQISIDWEAARIPLEAWKTCLSAAEMWTKGRHFNAVDVVEAKANLISSLSVFYITVCSEFGKYLISPQYAESRSVKAFDGKMLTQLQYDKLAFSKPENIDDKLLYYQLYTITFWSQQFGPFRTFNRVMDPAEALLYD